MGATLSQLTSDQDGNFWDTEGELARRAAWKEENANQSANEAQTGLANKRNEQGIQSVKSNKPSTTSAAPLPLQESTSSRIVNNELVPLPLQESTSSRIVNNELVLTQSQGISQVAPVNIEVESPTTDIAPERRRIHSGPYRNKFFFVLFVLHLAVVAAWIVYVTVKLVLQRDSSKLHNLKRWCPQLGADLIIGSVFGCSWQICFKKKPRQMAKVVLWSNGFLTLAVALMLVSTGFPVDLGLGVLCFIFAIGQSLYSCWVSRRLKYAGDVLSAALGPTNQLSCNYHISYWILFLACLWVTIWIFGVVGAVDYKYSALIILALLTSLAWTMEVLRNIAHSTVARVVSKVYLRESNPTHNSARSSFQRACTTSFGSICLGSMLVPVLHTLRVVARGLNRIEGQNEICFSCADCFVGVMDTFIRFAHNWGYVQVIVYGKPFVKASKDTWNLFTSCRMDVLINADLTSSLCVLSGVSGGMLCVLASGGWTFATHKALTASISVVAFFIGYFLVRIPMAVPQGSVAAHYVCYAEDPTNQQFLHSPVLERLRELWPQEV